MGDANIVGNIKEVVRQKALIYSTLDLVYTTGKPNNVENCRDGPVLQQVAKITDEENTC